MARVPQPALNAPTVGGSAAEAKNMPFLNLTVPDLGGNLGRQISSAGQQMGNALSAMGMNKIKQEDALKLRQLENEVTALENSYTTEIEGLDGQAKLDFLENSVDRYKEDLANITSKYSFGLRNNNDVSSVFSKQASNKFTIFALGERQKAFKAVAIETNKVGIANAVQSAVKNPEKLADPAFIQKVINLVQAPDTGMAALAGETGSTEESKNRIAALTQEIQMQVVSAVVADQLAQGKLRSAVAIVEGAAAVGEGSKGYTQLQAQILPFQNRIRGMDEFAALVDSKTAKDGSPPTLSSILLAISEEPDPDKRDRLRAEYGVYSSARTAEVNQRIKEQEAIFVQALLGGQDINDPKFKAQINDYLTSNGNLALGIYSGAKMRGVTTEILETKEQQAYKNQGYGVDIIPGLTRTIKDQFRNDPAAAVAIMANPSIKRHLTLEDSETLADLARKTRSSIETAQNKVPVASTYLKREFGFTNKEIEKKLPGASLEAIREAMLPFYKKAAQTGDTSQLDEMVRKAVAAKLVSIQTDPGLPFMIGRAFDAPSYDLAAEALIDNPDFKPYDAVLADTSDNRNVLSILFNKTPDAMKTVRDTLDDKDLPFTVNNISAELKQNPIADLQAVNGVKDQVYQLAIEAKYAPDFIEYLINGTKSTYTVENAAAIIKALEEEGTVGGIKYPQLLQQWIGSNGRQ